MKSILLAVFLCAFALTANGQLHLDDPGYVYQTVAGTTLEKAKVNELLHSRQHFTLKEESKPDGTFIVTLIPITDKEFHKIIKEKKKLARNMRKNIEGESITNHTFDKNKVTVYNFWFTTCPHCIEEIPKLNQIVKDFPEDVTFIAPTFNLEKNTFHYNIVTNGKSLAQDMHIRSYPSHYIINQNGVIKKVIIGSSNHVIRKVRRNIKRLLKAAEKG